MKITSEDVIDTLHILGDEVASFHIGEREMSLRDLYVTCRMAPEMTWAPECEFRNLAGSFVCTLGNVVTTNRHNQAASTLKVEAK